MKPYLFMLLTLVAGLGYSQSNSEVAVFNKVIGHTIIIEKQRMYIQCHKAKALFNHNAFKRMTPLEVPTTVLKEMDSNATQSCSGIWDSKLLLNTDFGDWIYDKKCLTTQEAQLMLEKAGQINVLSISSPIFDDDDENCIVSITLLRSGGGSSGQSYFLKKVYGVWVIVDIYDIWMS